ncbi:MAG TPA: hypothetical protein VNG53_06755 [Bacteroidia bacterium]|nr:hypothetical protein [Bacteroidia bacterium]
MNYTPKELAENAIHQLKYCIYHLLQQQRGLSREEIGNELGLNRFPQFSHVFQGQLLDELAEEGKVNSTMENNRRTWHVVEDFEENR